MIRPRKHDRHLPPCVYHRHGSYYYVKRGRWTNLGPDYAKALIEYARLVGQRAGSMPSLIEQAMPSILGGLAEQTRAQYQVAARRLQAIFAEFAPQDVRPVHVADVRRQFAASAAVANRTITVLRRVFDWALDEHIVESNPCIGIKRLAQKKRTRRITVGEYRAIREHAKPRLQIIMDLCYLTGQRIGDVLKIRRTDLLDDGVFIEQQKTGARLIVKWSPELHSAVDAALALHGPVQSLYVVKGIEGKPLGYHVAWKDWCAACEAAGVEDANIHDLRAMAGTESDAQGRNAQKLLGHTDEKMTRRYLRDRDAPIVEGPTFAQKTGRRSG